MEEARGRNNDKKNIHADTMILMRKSRRNHGLRGRMLLSAPWGSKKRSLNEDENLSRKKIVYLNPTSFFCLLTPSSLASAARIRVTNVNARRSGFIGQGKIINDSAAATRDWKSSLDGGSNIDRIFLAAAGDNRRGVARVDKITIKRPDCR